MDKDIYTCELYDISLDTIPFTEESITKLTNTLRLRGSEDPEVAHSLEKESYKHFISLIATDKLSKDEANLIAKKLMELSNTPFTRWYA
ncbi:hypothetical protein Klosneuvirus_3_16 [Klosneuvirus KNV1]|uniref:Uncharacterized protein n=1 Tax=Klosneuvirus KNV1 TaxID=1977640 RepID=A0A1V0SJP2_9VIRU|nr:hypothetical protein Klosneuvirus_3_16 [Klosneuvirus KNV1]